MSFWKIVTLTCTASIVVDAISLGEKRDISPNLCDTVFKNNTNKVQCYCVKDKKEPPAIKSADCFLTVQRVLDDDVIWSTFNTLGAVERIIFSNTKGIPLSYVPTQAIKETTNLTRLDIKYGTIMTVGSFAFANLSSLEEVTLRDNQIAILDPYSFIHHKDLKVISLDTNNIAEINRNVFVDLPALEKLYLTNNQINTIHDRAFLHLTNLRELEIDRNKVFSLNFAVFEGLTNLEKLDLSSNSLEVIGDNTFHALQNLKTLNLDGNKIQVLDDKAFNGLGKVISLSLAHNKLVYIDSDKVFEGLLSLVSLSFKGNKIKEFKSAAIEPILNNFYGASGSLDVEDNNFSCDCHLDWFVPLKNRTQNNHLKMTIENLKCRPSEKLRESWTKAQENEKNAQTEEEEVQGQAGDYEYYDDTQLNGTLFYMDVRYLLNCSTEAENTAVLVSTVKTTTTTEVGIQQPVVNLEAKNTSTNEIVNPDNNKKENNEIQAPTTRLASVSAKPEENKIYENMASDEAKPEKGKSHRSIQDERKDSASIENSSANSAVNNLSSVMMLIPTLSLRLLI